MSTDTQGLTGAEVRARIARGDVNRVVMPTSRTALEIVRANVLTRFNAILGALFVVIVTTGPWQDALFGGVLVVNTLIGIVQELRAKRTLDRLTLVSQPRARAVRSGRSVDIPTAEIVLDDILELASGDQVVVDGVLLGALGLEVDESLLTGESAAVAKRPGEEVLSGSFVVAGTGCCRVTRVGARAYGNRLASEARHFSLAHSELRAGINRILGYITWAIVPTAVLLFAGQFIIQAPVGDALLFSAAGVVAMVPEGLVLLTSLALAVGAVRLARHRTLVQDLPATETLARVDVICLDKTGTLTEREPRLEGVEMLGACPEAMDALAALAATELKPNATLLAIGRAYPWEQAHAVTESVPFSSARKWSGATLDGLGTWVLGAPDVLLADRPGSDTVRRRVEEHAASGRRVLLLARTAGRLTSDRLPDPLVPAALVLLTEQVRADAAETLRYFDAQGVTIKVLSGDHPATVSQVATRLGIAHGNDPVDASALPQDAQALAGLVETRSVFGRLSPQQKQSLIASLQAKGHVVAMVGDGVNDVLALKRADIGIAMGAGAGAARAVSHLVLLDNRFASLPSVIAEGRRVIGNVERLAALFLTKTVYAMLLALAVGIADVTFPFLPRHLTLVGALTIGIPAFFLSLERNDQRAQPGFVGRVLRFAVPSGLFVAGATFAAYALIHTYSGGSLAQARTAATVVLFAVASWVLVLVEKPLTPRRWLLLGGTVTAFVTVLGVPPLRAFFALDRLSPGAWLAVAVIAGAAAGVLHWSTAVAAHVPVQALKTRPLRRPEIVTWLLGADSPKGFLLAAAVLVVGSAWLFFGVLEDVISHDPLVEVDVFAHHLLQSLRNPLMDRAMIAVTELGDAQVLLPMIFVALAWFLSQRLWLTAGYWLAAIGVAEVLAKVLKLALHRQRPGAFYGGIEQFSFPSGHAVMSVVVYGFLAFLLCRNARPGLRRAVIAFTIALVGLIALSRLYLGAHWLSDVLGGASFGVTWIAALAIAYEYQSHDRLRPERFAALMLATLVIAGGAHIALSHDADRLRYAPQPMITPTSSQNWMPPTSQPRPQYMGVEVGDGLAFA
ncbi:MAG: HAD-IC family P-type ATPase [Thiomonas sp.]|uniref:HAD-IC family P-type ATPase n=1 Tax=Thiomonas sp. TaxID=2047785 RepID=UPI002A36DCC0|nr:HAD-IC family P-type ATPase [Thiomonas sp.]MDY0331522.1 HAD-IC family P-type ATPase [Thiomonas sp.]